jgi:tetratricopeptide (TPR) repeat protein
MKTEAMAIAILAGALAVPASLAQERFDLLVRNDIFAGFTGDAARLQRGIAMCEQALAENPNHPQALAWHGSAMLFLSGEEFQKGNQRKGMELYGKGTSELDRAVELAPDSLSVRLTRGPTLLTSTRFMPPSPVRQGLVEKARADYQFAYDRQRDALDGLSQHSLGELLQGLGDAYSRLDRPGEAQPFYELIQAKLAGTEYERRAAQWMRTKQPLPAAQAACVGCHTGK